MPHHAVWAPSAVVIFQDVDVAFIPHLSSTEGSDLLQQVIPLIALKVRERICPIMYGGAPSVIDKGFLRIPLASGGLPRCSVGNRAQT